MSYRQASGLRCSVCAHVSTPEIFEVRGDGPICSACVALQTLETSDVTIERRGVMKAPAPRTPRQSGMRRLAFAFISAPALAWVVGSGALRESPIVLGFILVVAVVAGFCTAILGKSPIASVLALLSPLGIPLVFYACPDMDYERVVICEPGEPQPDASDSGGPRRDGAR